MKRFCFYQQQGGLDQGARKPIPLRLLPLTGNRDAPATCRQGLDAGGSFSSRSDTAVPAVL